MAAERIEVTGIVQGVGFRPFVYRLATELGLSGCVGNDAASVFIDAVGPSDNIDLLVGRISEESPQLAAIEDLRRWPIGDPGTEGFSIVESRAVTGERTLVSPDVAVCSECLSEMFESNNRRYRHPFITCTNCGPRFSIIRSLPYDRPATTMAGFEMCPACQSEYSDPADRRYHAQPISCHNCGPQLAFESEAVTAVRDSAITAACSALDNGSVVGIKGIGGFHLACDASAQAAVSSLRDRKNRPEKPFAVMVADVEAAEALALMSSSEEAELTSPARPIVLLRARAGNGLPDLVAPGNPLIGVMLPYSPVHHLLLHERRSPLVVTSANVAGQPIIHRDVDVRERLIPLCDAVLTHDRPIHVPCDDSVVRLVGDRLMPVRRARGYAPIPVGIKSDRSVLAVGGELKNTFCVTSRNHAWVSQHIGEMQNIETMEAFESLVEQFAEMYAVEPECVAVDSHPGYLSSNWGRSNHGSRVVEIQHHHAHVAAVMAEHGLAPKTKVLGFAFDGTAYGDDGTIWGGEVLVADVDGYERIAHLAPIPLPGGDAAIRNPCRVALAHLFAAGLDWDDRIPAVSQFTEAELHLLHRQLSRGVGCVLTSSMGRLLDAVASLLGLRHQISFEAQAAIDLEIAAESGTAGSVKYRFAFDGRRIDPSSVLEEIVVALLSGVAPADIALGFHRAVADLVASTACQIGTSRRYMPVVLSGGVFQNALLVSLCVAALEAEGFPVLTHSVVPPNDGGLALGQAFIAANRTEED